MIFALLVGLAPAAAPPTTAHADRPLPVTDCSAAVPPGARAILAADVMSTARCSNDPSIVGSRGIVANAVVLENVTLERWSGPVWASYGDVTRHDVRASGEAEFRAERGRSTCGGSAWRRPRDSRRRSDR